MARLFPIDAAHGYIYRPTYPVSTDDYGARQDTTDLTREILAQVDEVPVPPWTSGALIVASDSVRIDASAYFAFGSILMEYGSRIRSASLMGYAGTSGQGVSLYLMGGDVLQMNFWGGAVQFWVNGSMIGSLSGAKSFVIEHPTDPDRYLVHACLEGPEAAVFYRGEAQLDEVGYAQVQLPDYFTALVDESGATVQVTPVLDGPEDAFGPVAATRVREGGFVVRGSPMQNVAWRVEAARADINALVVEPQKRDVNVRGNGPYRWIQPEE